jgi:DNA mismatch repair protein MutS
MFLEDAHIGSKILGITLTARSRGKDGRIPMAGVPFHALDNYLAKLVKAGYKVAICEQVGEVEKGKALVEREVIRIVTPGTLLDEQNLEAKENNFIVALSYQEKNLALSLADLSTGKFQSKEWSLRKDKHKEDLENLLKNQLSLINPQELLLNKENYDNPSLLKILKQNNIDNIFCYQSWQDNLDQASQILKLHFHVKSLEGFGFHVKNNKNSIKTAAALLSYLKETQKSDLAHIKKIEKLGEDKYLKIDRSSIINLEILETIRGNKKEGSLISVIDQTQTAMGSRLLRYSLLHPLKEKTEIEERLRAVEELNNQDDFAKKLKELLTEITDLERITAKLASGIALPRDLIRLRDSLFFSEQIKKLINQKRKNQLIKTLALEIDPKLFELAKKIEKTIVEEPPVDPKQGKLIKAGVSLKIDQLKSTINSSRDWLTKLEEAERKRTGISSLKLRFNKVFGFYIEISKSNLDKAPENYQRKQTLVNAERFITPELKEHEEIILSNEELSQKLEYQIFLDLVAEVVAESQTILNAAKSIALLDLLLSFSIVSEKYNYQKPIIKEWGELEITEGRHPVVENLVKEENFVPNDTFLSNKKQQLILITGPNMAGKSVYIRQVAIITLLAHLGSFVPASKAEIPICDQIFVRSGASDAISDGYSTFMVEMLETAYILNHASKRSLIIMDEIGRGTSTYDGISLAWAIAEYIVQNENCQAKTLFATHYHELQSLEEIYPEKIVNHQMAIDGNRFLYKLIKGASSHSHGLNVAELAGIPKDLIKRAQEILTDLEKDKLQDDKEQLQLWEEKNSIKKIANSKEEKIVQKLKKIDIAHLSPVEALVLLDNLQKKAKDS